MEMRKHFFNFPSWRRILRMITIILCCSSTQIMLGQTASIINSTDVLCNGDCSGSATVDVTGGVAPYTFIWDDPGAQATQTAVGLCAGIYNVTATDNNGNTATAAVTITEPTTPVTVAITSQDANCIGGADGSMSAVANGGIGSFTFLWSTGNTTPTITGLSAGIHTLTVTDANGCSATTIGTISEPATGLSTIAVVTSDYNGQDISCNGFCDGSAMITATGGTAPYSYQWPTGETTPSSSGLCAGVYTATITDANGCVTHSTVALTEPSPITPSIVNIIDPSCSNCSDGSLTGSATGGTPPYVYQWNLNGTPISGGVSQTVTNLPAGNYTLQVGDINGCINIIPQQLGNSILVSNIVVAGQSGVTDILTGNTLQMVATILPSNASNSSVTWSVTNGTGTATISPTGLLTGMSPGTVVVCATAVDGSGSQGCATITILPLTNGVCQNGTFSLDNAGQVVINAAQLMTNTTGYTNILVNGSPSQTYDCASVGLTTTATVTADSTNGGGTYTCISTISIIDPISPVIACQNYTAALDAFGNALITASDLDAGSSDNCNVLNYSLNGQPSLTFSSAQIGTHNVNLAVTDNSGNTSSCISTVTIQDTTFPTAICQNLSLNIGTTGGSVIVTPQDIDGGSYDNSSIDNININGQSSVTFTTADLGPNIVTLTVTDIVGNQSVCTATVTITNNLTPSLEGYVAIDTNNNCVMDLGEIPMSNTTIQINDNGTIYNTIVDANGYYSIVLAPGTYDVSVILPSGITACQGTQQITIPATPTTQILDWSINSPNVIGRIALDPNVNCLVEPLEQGLENKMILFQNGINSYYTSSDANGYYFLQVPTGLYAASVLSSLNGLYTCQSVQTVTIPNNITTEVNWAIRDASVSGRVALDDNLNCLVDNNENGLQGIIISFEKNGQFYYTSTYDTLGNYEIMLPDTGDYNATIYTNVGYQPCSTTQSINLAAINSSITLDWPLEVLPPCPNMQVSISAPFLRMTNGGSWYSISYSNIGTGVATDAYVTIEVDPYLIVTSTSIPITSQNGNLYTFYVGDVYPSSYGYFSISVVVDQSGIYWSNAL